MISRILDLLQVDSCCAFETLIQHVFLKLDVNQCNWENGNCKEHLEVGIYFLIYVFPAEAVFVFLYLDFSCMNIVYDIFLYTISENVVENEMNYEYELFL